MPNIKSAKKELRKSKKRNERNVAIKDNVKKLIKKTRKAAVAKDSKAEELLRQTFKALDKAAQKGVMKKNTTDRNKSRLNKKLNKSKK